jgi:hypothetical protein
MKTLTVKRAMCVLPAAAVQLPTILRAPPSTHSLVYRADPRGHVTLTAMVNGAPMRFLADTGASRVTLTADDARAVGIARVQPAIANRKRLSSRSSGNAARDPPRAAFDRQLSCRR